MGCKPAALFPLDAAAVYPLLRALPPNIRRMTIREQRGGALLFIFDGAMLGRTILRGPVREFLMGMGYPARPALVPFLAHLQKQFERDHCPHEVGLFLGYPLDDVRGFIRYRGSRCKLCGAWKVYGDVERAKIRFREYELCREYMGKYLGKKGNYTGRGGVHGDKRT
jgi:hypothetical protein